MEMEEKVSQIHDMVTQLIRMMAKAGDDIKRININVERLQSDVYEIKKELRHQRADINYLEEQAQIKQNQ